MTPQIRIESVHLQGEFFLAFRSCPDEHGVFPTSRIVLLPQYPRTTLYWLRDSRLHEAAELPGGGDNSYPGSVELDDTWLAVLLLQPRGQRIAFAALRYLPCGVGSCMKSGQRWT